MILAICTCGERYEVKDGLAGTQMRCFGCSQRFYVPGLLRTARKEAARAARSGGRSPRAQKASRGLATGTVLPALSAVLAWFGSLFLAFGAPERAAGAEAGSGDRSVRRPVSGSRPAWDATAVASRTDREGWQGDPRPRP